MKTQSERDNHAANLNGDHKQFYKSRDLPQPPAKRGKAEAPKSPASPGTNGKKQ